MLIRFAGKSGACRDLVTRAFMRVTQKGSLCASVRCRLRSILRLGALVAFAAVVACSAEPGRTKGDGDWRAEMGQIRMAVKGAEDDPTMARRWSGYKMYLERVTGLPVKLFEASDYNGVVQALASGQVDLAQLGAGSYANVDAQVGELVAPLMVIRQAEGNTGYYSVLLVNSSSPYRSLQDLRGKTLGYVDFNSTSGFLYPRHVMRQQGVEPDTYFGRTMMAGGQTQTVMSLVNGQFDGAMVMASGGSPEIGFTTGAHFTMARRGLIDIDDVRIVWTAGPMPNSPVVVRTDRNQAFIDLVRGALSVLPYDEPAIWDDIGQASGGDFASVDRAFYKDIIQMRSDDIAQRRGQPAREEK
ncbi:MAG: hypothetical protein FD124_2098 [Alphaproteobacteria bacterium]|nr:MAG: hypothetical protein FD160_584 [Caulobacteraceae bacterium]TPW05563.1 MAG: hypothetical protein FD124_2098 [Alphaproteobacteria bacterium]